MTDIKSYCTSMNAFSIEFCGEGEDISDADAGRALGYAKWLPIRTASDVVLFCASVNLMNAYVKQGDHKKTFGYGFKRYVGRLLKRLRERPIQGVAYSVSDHKSMSLVLISIHGLQFSYHNVPYVDAYYDTLEIPFDGLHKQPCAGTLFLMAEANPLLDRELLPGPAPLRSTSRASQVSMSHATQERRSAPADTGAKTRAEAVAREGRALAPRINCTRCIEHPTWIQDSVEAILAEQRRRERLRKKILAAGPMPAAGDTVLCKVTRLGEYCAYVVHKHGRGLVPYAEMPSEWSGDPLGYIGVGDVLRTRVSRACDSGFLKLSGRECEIVEYCDV